MASFRQLCPLPQENLFTPPTAGKELVPNTHALWTAWAAAESTLGSQGVAVWMPYGSSSSLRQCCMRLC